MTNIFMINNKLNYEQESANKKNVINSINIKIKETMNEYGYIEFDPKQHNKSEIAYIFSIGGDGTMLHSMQESEKDSIIIGINAGNIGFLTPYIIDDVFNESIFSCLNKHNKEHRIEKRSMIKLKTKRISVFSVNELAFNAEETNHTIDFSLSILRDEHLSKAGYYKANTLLISAPCGSTAYNMNAGGSIIDPSMRCMQIMMIAPTTLGIRPLIIGENSIMQLYFQQPIRVFSDGMLVDTLLPGEKIEISMATEDVSVLVPDNWNFYSVLSKKLHWNNGKEV